MFKFLVALAATIILSACTPLMYFPLDGSDPVTFNLGDPAPALVLCHDRATLRGWSQDDITAWEPFSIDVWKGESNFCPNILRGVRLVGDGAGCVVARQGLHSDSGIAQVLMGYPTRPSWYIPTSEGVWSLHENAILTCPTANLCTPADVIASPESSMDAYLILIENTGKQPWCYDKRARRLHLHCNTAPNNPPIILTDQPNP